MKARKKDRKDCPHCSRPLETEEVKCPFCGSVLMDTALDMDEAELEE